MEEKTKRSPEKPYEKPIFEKEDGLTFPRDVMEAFNGGKMCLQCTACHGCK